MTEDQETTDPDHQHEKTMPDTYEPPAEVLEQLQALRVIYEDYDITRIKQRTVLAAALVRPVAFSAAKMAGVDPGTVYKWLGRLTPVEKWGEDTAFKAAWKVVTEMAVGRAEEELVSRMMAGKGDKHSADLLKFWLQAMKERYNPKQRHSLGGDGTVVETKVTLNKGGVRS